MFPPRQDGVKGAAAAGALAHSGGGRERYGGGRASLRRQRRRDVAAARGAPCVLPGKLSRITGAWPWWAAPAPRRGGVESDLRSHTGFLVAAAAALASRARLWGPC